MARSYFSIPSKKIDRRVNLKSKNLSPPSVILALLLAALVVLLTAETALAQSFAWPVDVHPPGQKYADYGVIVPGMYHTGMDMGYEGTYDYSKTVKAVRTGVVHKVFGLSTGLFPSNLSSSNNVRRWNSSTGVYSWDGQPTTDRLGQAYGMDNHGLGMCVIIYHPDLQLYTLYGHMDAVVAGLTPGQGVSAGTPIGKMGNSHKQYLRRGDTLPPTPSGPLPPGVASWSSLVITDSTGFRLHVHLEVKDRGILTGFRTDDDGRPFGQAFEGWGYTVAHPNWHGYHNPNVFLNETVTMLSEPVPIEVVVSSSVDVRDYPSTDSSLSLVITGVGQGTVGEPSAFVAIRSVGNKWYQIHLPNAGTEGWSASGWIAGPPYTRTNSALSQLEIIPESARVRAQPSSTSSTLVFVYGAPLLSPQRFVLAESISGWQRIYLPQKSIQQDGWISASDVQAPCHLWDSSKQPVPLGFGAAYNVLSPARELLLRALCRETSAEYRVGNGFNFQYIYNQGYFWTGSNWQMFNYQCQGQTVGGAWCVGNATHTPNPTSIQLPKNSYLAYVCNWTGSAWKCGCRDETCVPSYWNLQQFMK